MKIDTGTPEFRVPIADANISYHGRAEHAERKARQIKNDYYSCDTIAEIDSIRAREVLTLDAIAMEYPEYAAMVDEAEQECRGLLAPHPCQPVADIPIARNGNPTKENKPMNAFAEFDAGGSGSEGPWLSWSARGTQDGAIPRESFYIRDSDGNKTVFDFSRGVVLDIDAMRTGWQKSDGVAGQAPEWKFNQTVAQMMPSPGEEWKRGFEIRCAIGGGETATWQQAGAGVWGGFTSLVPALQEQPAGKLPLVRHTGAKAQQFKRGGTSEPLLEVVKWVDRPDCLKEGEAAGIATEPPAPQPAPQPDTHAPTQQMADQEF